QPQSHHPYSYRRRRPQIRRQPDPEHPLEDAMNTRSRKHAWGQTLTSGIVLGIPVLLLAAFGLSAYVTFTPVKSAEADKQPAPAAQALAAVDPAPAAQAVAAPKAKKACCA